MGVNLKVLWVTSFLIAGSVGAQTQFSGQMSGNFGQQQQGYGQFQQGYNQQGWGGQQQQQGYGQQQQGYGQQQQQQGQQGQGINGYTGTTNAGGAISTQGVEQRTGEQPSMILTNGNIRAAQPCAENFQRYSNTAYGPAGAPAPGPSGGGKH